MVAHADCYAEAQFSSLSACITHALAPGEDRGAAYEEAGAAMVAEGRWRGYRMLFSPKVGMHIGYRYENPKDWYLLDGLVEGHGDTSKPPVIEGPFRSKKFILSHLRVKTSRACSAGVYKVGERYTLFTRDKAVGLKLNPEELP